MFDPMLFFKGINAAQNASPETWDKLSKTWPARMAQAAWGAATLPGDVWHGKVDPMSEEGIGRANDLASLSMSGTLASPKGALGAGPTLPKKPNIMAVEPPTPMTMKPPIKPEDALLALHNTRPDRLAAADKLGGFAVPSIAVAKPSLGFNNFGDISLIASPEFVKPSKTMPVFASDVYSPRFPNLNDEGTKIFKGFTDMGNRRYSPLTLENVVKEMKGNIRGGEGFNYGAGSIRASVTPQFKDLPQIQSSRDRIISREQFEPIRQEANDKFFTLAEEFKPYYKFSSTEHSNDFASMLTEMRTKGDRVFAEGYKDLPPEMVSKAKDYLNWLKQLPTEYFEAKPQRGVGINEFKGAVVPIQEMETVAPILQKHGLRIEPYDATQGSGKVDNSIAARAEALRRFKEYFFAIPAAAGVGATALNPQEPVANY